MIRTFLASIFGGWWLPVLALTLLAGAFGTGYVKGRIAGSQKAEIEKLETLNDQLRADRVRLKRQLENAGKATQAINRQSGIDAEIIEDMKGKLDEYEIELGKAGNSNAQCDVHNRFILGPGDVERLRKLQ